MTPDESERASELRLPEKVTLAWLFAYVPASAWLSLGGALVTAFIIGVATGQPTFVQELIGREPKPSPTPVIRTLGELDRTTPDKTPVPPPPHETPAVPSPSPLPVLSPAEAAIQVWVNTDSGVYHCPKARWYGKTKEGEHMTQGRAVAAGHRPDHGRPCRG